MENKLLKQVTAYFDKWCIGRDTAIITDQVKMADRLKGTMEEGVADDGRAAMIICPDGPFSWLLRLHVYEIPTESASPSLKRRLRKEIPGIDFTGLICIEGCEYAEKIRKEFFEVIHKAGYRLTSVDEQFLLIYKDE